MDPKQFGPFLAQTRKERGLTQAQLAELLGVTSGAVSKWECCLCLPDVSKLADIAQALDLNILEVLKAERLPAEGADIPDREEQVYSATLDTVARQTNRRLKRWAAVLAAAAAVALLAVYFPLWHIAAVWEPSYFETGEVSQLAYIGSREDRRIARQVMARAEEAFSTLGLTREEAQSRFGCLGRYTPTHPDAVSERHSLKLWSARFQLTTGTMWMYYSREELDGEGNMVCGAGDVPVLWQLDRSDSGEWEVTVIKEHP